MKKGFEPEKRKEIIQYVIHNNFKTLDQIADRFNTTRYKILQVIDYYEDMYGRTFYRRKKER